MTLHPALRGYLDQLNPLIEQAAAAGVMPTPESARAALAGLNQFAAPAKPIAVVEDRVIADVPVRVYDPSPEVASDVIYFIHGGGHMAGDLDVYDYSARRLADAAHSSVDAELASARLTGQLLAVLPGLGLGLGFVGGGDPLGFLIGTPLGQGCVVVAVGLLCAGLIWTEKLSDVEVNG